MRGMSTTYFKAALCLAAASMCLAAQQTGQKAAEPQEPAKTQAPASPAAESAKTGVVTVDPKYTLGPEDVIVVKVWRENDLSGPLSVRPDGKITMPLINEVQAAGLTPDQLAKRISDQLSKYINDPQVMVQVQAVRSQRYYITGEVNRPGAYPLAVPTTVFEAITMAGGFRDFANKKKITIMRGSQRIKFNYNEVVKGKNTQQNILLENGDQVIVP